MIIHLDTTRYIWEVMENQEYSFLFKDLTVVDVGCDIGSFSLWVYPFAREIYAVDMSKKAIDLFNETIKDNNLDKIKTQVNRIGSVAKQEGGVVSITLAEYLKSVGRVDVLKMDVEGDEIDIVNAPNFPKEKIVMIVGEHHYSDSNELLRFKNRLDILGYEYLEYPNNHYLARRK